MQETAQDNLDTPRNSSEILGALLTKARMERGLEQREAATRTGLSLQIIRALEEGNLQGLEAPVFIRSYLLRYARLLGVPEQEVLQHYKQLGFSEAPPLRVTRTVKPQTKISDRGIRWFSYLLVLAVVGWLGWLGFEEVRKHLAVSDSLAPVSSLSGEGDTLLPLPQQPEVPATLPSTSGSGSSTPPTVREPVATDQSAAPPMAAMDSVSGIQAEQTATELAQSSAASDVPAADPETTPAVAGEDEDRVVLELTGDCWVDIKDANGEQLAYGTLRSGTVHALSGSAPFALILGNSGAVNISLNGETVDPGTYVKRGGVSRFVLGSQRQENGGT